MSKAQKNKNSNLITRAVTGAIYVTVVVLCSYLGGLTLQIVFGILTALMLYEFCALFKDSPYRPQPIATTLIGTTIYFIGVQLFGSSQYDDMRLFAGLLFVMALMTLPILGIIELFRKTLKPANNIGVSVMGIAYIVPAMVVINVISKFGNEEVNMFPLLGIFIMIWTFDTFAYLVGRKIGKTKMAETLSPKKSWEGFAGGAVATIIAGLTIAFFKDGNEYLAYVVLAIISCLFGTLGDLFESMIKRQLNLKDSGKILPGHGGLLDRFDSVLFVMPIAVVVITLFTLYFK